MKLNLGINYEENNYYPVEFYIDTETIQDLLYSKILINVIHCKPLFNEVSWKASLSDWFLSHHAYKCTRIEDVISFMHGILFH